jgi:hypothetical protein
VDYLQFVINIVVSHSSYETYLKRARELIVNCISVGEELTDISDIQKPNSILELFMSERSNLKRTDTSPAAWAYKSMSLSPSAISHSNIPFDSFNIHTIKILIKVLETSQRNYKSNQEHSTCKYSAISEELFCFLFELCLDRPSKIGFKESMTIKNKHDIPSSFYLASTSTTLTVFDELAIFCKSKLNEEFAVSVSKYLLNQLFDRNRYSSFLFFFSCCLIFLKK